MSDPRIAGVECPTRESRALLTDDEFWPYVLQGVQPESEPTEPDFDESTTSQNEPCTECGEVGACGTDMEGRPMVHIQENGEQE